MLFVRLRKTVFCPDTYNTIQYELSLKDTILTSVLLAL